MALEELLVWKVIKKWTAIHLGHLLQSFYSVLFGVKHYHKLRRLLNQPPYQEHSHHRRYHKEYPHYGAPISKYQVAQHVDNPRKTEEKLNYSWVLLSETVLDCLADEVEDCADWGVDAEAGEEHADLSHQ